MSKFWDWLKIEDLPNEDLRWIAEHHGLDVAKSIWRTFSGSGVKCPVRKTFDSIVCYIKENFDKSNHQLAREFGVSSRTVSNYMNRRPARTAKAINPRQTTLL
jgi:predicted HTH transcriptional regulator